MFMKVGACCLLHRSARCGREMIMHKHMMYPLSALPGFNHVLSSSSVMVSSRMKSISILEQSAVLFQDGLEIQELPWVIRRLNPRDFPFAVGMTYTGDSHQTHQHEDEFIRRLHECANVQQILKLLEVPGERVTAASAAFALQRLCQLRSVSASDDGETFVRKAVMHELCETVALELAQLNNETVVSLAGCAALASSNYDQRFTGIIMDEVEKRVGDSVFSLTNLCSLIRALSVGARGDVAVTENLWIHLGSRYKEIDASNIADVYRILRYITPKAQYLWRVIERQLQQCWWKLTGDDIAAISSRVAVAGRQSSVTLAALGKWLHANVAVATDAELRSLLAAHADFDVVLGDGSFASALERYVVARISQMDRTAVAMAVDFFRRRRWMSARVLDAVARDFELNGKHCTPHEIVFTLRAFGQLNYSPPNAASFFAAIEDVLSSKFNEFDSAALVELLASFVYIERFPVNFIGNIFTPHFVMQIKGIRDSTVRQRAGNHLLQLQAAYLLECRNKKYLHIVDRDILKLSLKWLEGRSFKLHQEVGLILRKLVGDDKFNEMFIPRFTPYIIDFELFTDESKNPLENSMNNKDKQSVNKIAVLTVMPEHYCINTRHLLGENATKQRHLQCLGYTIIGVDYETFMWKHRSHNERIKYLKALLDPHCRLLDCASTSDQLSGNKKTELPLPNENGSSER